LREWSSQSDRSRSCVLGVLNGDGGVDGGSRNGRTESIVRHGEGRGVVER